MKRALAVTALLALFAGEAAAWPATVMESLLRDARRLVPRSLGMLMQDHEKEILEEAQHLPPEMGQAFVLDLSTGALRPETLTALDAHGGQAVALFKQRRVTEAVIRLGTTFRVAADVSDPVLVAGAEGYPPGVVREYYAFVEGNLDKIPVVLDEEAALSLPRDDLTGYWQRLLGRSRDQSGVIRTELFQNGRVVSHRAIDYRSPVFGVASLSYSRAVTAIAATWLVYWREVRGDTTRQPKPVFLVPSENHSDPLAKPTPRPPMEARKP